MKEININDIKKADEVLRKYLKPSPLILNEWLSSKYNCNVYLKLENLQPVGSFKIRGALNKISSLREDQKKAGVIAVSAGNHAQGVAWASRMMKIHSTIVMPENAPLTKIKRTRSLGSQVILKGKTFGEAYEYTQELLKKSEKVFIHPFQDPLIAAGQGVISLELSKQIEKIDYLFTSIGGGGLATGIGVGLKSLFPDCKIMGSQAKGTHSMVESLKANKVVSVNFQSTIADGIKVKSASPEMLSHLSKIIDETFVVSEQEIAISILKLLENTCMLVEGAGAINLAALDQFYTRYKNKVKDKNIVLVLCGGNIDSHLLERVIEKSLFYKKRRWRFKLLMEDIPGELNKLTDLLYKNHANILDVSHQREKENLMYHESIVNVLVELRDADHFDLISKNLKESFTLIE